MHLFLASTLEATERRQAILRTALERLAALHCPEGEADAEFWSVVRDSMLSAGATAADIDAAAAHTIAFILQTAGCDSEQCQELIETVLEHLTCCEEVEIRIRNGAVVSVRFPGREVH